MPTNTPQDRNGSTMRSLSRRTLLLFCGISLGIVVVGLLAYHTFFTTRIAYVETGKLIEGFSEAAKAQNKLDRDIETWDAELKMLNDSLNSTLERMKTEFDRASAKQKADFKKELTKRNSDLARYAQSVQEKKTAREQELMKPVVDKINTFLQVWGNKHGYDLILGTAQGGNIVQADKKLDVTVQVLTDLNEHYKD